MFNKHLKTLHWFTMGVVFGFGIGVRTIRDDWYANLVLFFITMFSISILTLDILLDNLNNRKKLGNCFHCGLIIGEDKFCEKAPDGYHRE